MHNVVKYLKRRLSKIEVEMEAERREPDRCQDHLRYLRVERRTIEALIRYGEAKLVA